MYGLTGILSIVTKQGWLSQPTGFEPPKPFPPLPRRPTILRPLLPQHATSSNNAPSAPGKRRGMSHPLRSPARSLKRTDQTNPAQFFAKLTELLCAATSAHKGSIFLTQKAGQSPPMPAPSNPVLWRSTDAGTRAQRARSARPTPHPRPC